TPPPTIIMQQGKASISKDSSQDKTHFLPNSISPSVLGRDPVARIMLFGTMIVFSSPDSYSTDIVPATGEKMLGPNIRPKPLYISIFPFFIRLCTPWYKVLIILFFRS